MWSHEIDENAKEYEKSKYMIASDAWHRTGDVSRDPAICEIYAESDNVYIGRWLVGLGYERIQFPKNTTRDLTEKEKEKYKYEWFQIVNNPPFRIII